MLSVLRRWISGKPFFVTDGENIQDKLLERGLSQRQVLSVLYAVSAIFALLSLFLLLPTGATLGLVLMVVGVGVWFGVQQLGYLEFGEIQRIAQRAIEQRSIVLNNLAVRRAADELKNTRDFHHVCCILEDAFSSNDFDGFDLEVKIRDDGNSSDLARESGLEKTTHFRWSKPSDTFLRSGPAWSLTLRLTTTTHQSRGSMKIYRRYQEGSLLLDINFLTSVFPQILTDALDRADCSELPLDSTRKVYGLGEVS